MKGKNLMITALLILAAGIVLIICRDSIHSTGVVITGGILFILAGLLNILVFEGGRKKNNGGSAVGATFSWLTSAGALILGICMLIFQSTFAGLVPVMFGILVAFAALYQYYILAIGARPVLLPGWLYIFPTAMVIGAVYIFVQRGEATDYPVMLASGISLAVFGVAGLIEAPIIGHYNRHPDAVVAKASREMRRRETASEDKETASSVAPAETPAEDTAAPQNSADENHSV